MESSGGNGPDEKEKIVCREARLTLDQQIDKLENSDRKAMSLFRSNILLLGLILTALSIIVQSDNANTEQFINLSSLTGLGFLLWSTFLAAMAYTSSSFDMGIDRSIIEESEDPDYDSDDFRSDVRESYKTGIKHNNDVGSFNATLVTLTILCAYTAIILFASGTIVGAFELKLSLESGLLFVGSLAVSAVLCSLIYSAEWLFMKIFPEE